ncbi:hypothetical protein [Devosia sp. Root105]|uniref:hypothetical protein n=1 Tax=Devosia sp. Root105 TaxID=1736423 RepID=UPI0006FEE6D3|nr:hypothetical protein [Devosia sp. Root105]KQU93948.1 hypothetical protein ASC68_19930 [Devosia sp. Root105]
MILVIAAATSLITIFAEPLGWVAIGFALAAGWFRAPVLAVAGLAVITATTRLLLYSPAPEDLEALSRSQQSNHATVETLIGIQPWMNAGAMILVVVLMFRVGRWLRGLVQRLLAAAEELR